MSAAVAKRPKDHATQPQSCGTAVTTVDNQEVIQRPVLSQRISVRRSGVLHVLRELAKDNMDFFEGGGWIFSTFQHRYAKCCRQIFDTVNDMATHVSTIQSLAPTYDYDEHTPGNGYRSIVCIVDMCVVHLVRLLRYIKANRGSYVMRTQHYCKELEAYTAVWNYMSTAVRHMSAYVRDHQTDLAELFPLNVTRLDSYLSLMRTVERMDNACFYGRALGFQFAPSLVRVFQFLGVLLAAYSVRWERGGGSEAGDNNTAGSASKLGVLFDSGRFLLSPELRAKRIVKVTREADISLCKGFWGLSEEGLYHRIPAWLGPQLAANHVFEIAADEPIELAPARAGGAPVQIPPPGAHTGPRPVQARLLSTVCRQGMAATVAGIDTSNVRQKSKYLVLHCHGGGFVATSSRSHEAYLRYWAKILDCPILSVDYSLAPENPYPRPTEEVLYAYAWACANPEKIGHFTGSGSGASPARIMHMMDPLLHNGIVLRCIAAYSNILKEIDPEALFSVMTLYSLNAQKRETEKSASGEKGGAQQGGGSALHKTLAEYCDEVRKQVASFGVDAPTPLLYGPDAASNDAVISLMRLDSSSASDTAGGTAQLGAAHAAGARDGLLTPREDVGERQVAGSAPAKGARFDLGAPVLEDTPESFLAGASARGRSRTDANVVDKCVSTDMDVDEGDVAPLYVEVHEDGSRIWLSAEQCDEDLVDYLSRHPQTKDSVCRQSTDGVAQNSPVSIGGAENRSRADLAATASMPSPSPPIAVGNEPSVAATPPDTNKLKSLSQSFSDAASLITGHMYDNISGLAEVAGGEDVVKRPLARSDSMSSAMASLGYADDDPRASIYENMVHRLLELETTRNHELSPMYTPAEVLAQLPPVHFVCGHLDPLLDDTVAFARRCREAGAPVRGVDLLDALPHGFLNFTLLSPECRRASRLVVDRLARLLTEDKGPIKEKR